MREAINFVCVEVVTTEPVSREGDLVLVLAHASLTKNSSEASMESLFCQDQKYFVIFYSYSDIVGRKYSYSEKVTISFCSIYIPNSKNTIGLV